MEMSGTDAATRLRFPDYEDGSRLEELSLHIADALDTVVSDQKGSPFERLIQFAGYPAEFALWWDGFTCELGCSAPCGVSIDAVAEQLVASGAFEAT